MRLAGGRAVSYDPGSPVTISANVAHPSCAADHEAVVVPMLPAQQQYYGGKRMRSQGYGGWSVPEADSTRTVLRMISAQELDPQLGRTGMVPPPAPPGRCTFGIGVERLAVCLRGKLSPIHWLLYSAVQTASAVCAGATSAWVFGTNVAPCPSDASALGWARAGACEALFTFALCLVVLHVSTKATTAGNSYFGLATGFSVYAGIVSVGAVSGGVFNPAVGVGLWLADGLMGGGYPPCVALYLLAPPVGASIAALLFRACSPRVLGRVWMA